MYKPQHAVDEKKIADVVAKKVEISRKIRELRLEMSKLNEELIKSGAGINEIAAW
jgi:hypothetical protein